MIGYLKGSIIAKTKDAIIVDVHDVGYEVFMSGFAVEKVDGDVSLHIHTHVREQEISLYGFLTKEELRMFEMLISISGIGPKAALNILSIADVPTLSTAIAHKDTSILTRVSGIGKKTAEKVILELSGKVVAPIDAAIGNAMTHADAIDALRSLGYSASEARDALSNVPKDVKDVGECVRLALKYLGK
ncbi:MAG: Holliday junction branch migration protein RuvA [Parcubacteria group bacterium]|jgi:Holliday junction DNA helicase RuvA